VALGGAILDLSLLAGFVPAVGTAFTIVDNDGSDAVSGTFAGLAEGAILDAGSVLFSISYEGGDGNDVVLTATAPPPPPVGVTIIGTSRKDVVDASSTVAGQPLPTAFADAIDGRGGKDSLSGLGGDDTILGAKGKDTLSGDDGNDYLKGGRGADGIYGGEGDDTLRGGEGKDLLDGGAGDDWLDGGTGRNLLIGGEDNDTFAFTAKPGKGIGVIADYAAGEVIAISRSAFKGIGPKDALEAEHFHAGNETETKKATILYDEDRGLLLYAKGDADPVKFARIGKHLDLDHSDFLVI
jgi:Ca2+-binding RTX toxin-like protein